MRIPTLPILLAISVLAPNAASAWWDEGHMQVAAVAYERLTPQVREKVDALIRLNPQFSNWTSGYPEDRAAQYAFVRASIWADDIKKPENGYANDGEESKGRPEASQNIGYHDHLMHKYWHYMDIGFSTDGTPVKPPDPVNAVSQIKALAKGLSPSSGLPDSVRSYDLVWLLHLVGDAHQPLHATARFFADLPDGDQGGNKQSLSTSKGESIKLHFYWDSLLGSYSTPEGAVRDALIEKDLKLPPPDETLAKDLNPDNWFKESQQVAIQFSYAEPVKSGSQPYKLDRTYETNAREVARKQAALAGARLANLINDALK
jgi:S1/P1 Nuclease